MKLSDFDLLTQENNRFFHQLDLVKQFFAVFQSQSMLSFLFSTDCNNGCAFCWYSLVFRLSASYSVHQEVSLIQFGTGEKIVRIELR